MKPREQGGVVDKRLNVYGTQNLKCADLSICPVSNVHYTINRSWENELTKKLQDNLGTNTYSSALLVGEKAADLLCEELGSYIFAFPVLSHYRLLHISNISCN